MNTNTNTLQADLKHGLAMELIRQGRLEEKFGTVYRARISVMLPGHELFWHIDTDTSVLCRMQIAVDAENSSFQFRNRIEGERHLEMKNGKLVGIIGI